ncbi:serine/threonine protein kinase [Amycolatopsis taiwanensis]|uniref:serine/threonine protein kinase n=1 Tax=Amycolatopsis taiwanensis TaxID=342230 RepID=UPI0004850E6A|nr:protein kinase [Amycolatopsis taiwanensis]
MVTISGSELLPIGQGPVATVYSGWCAGEKKALKVFPAKFDGQTLGVYERERGKLAELAVSAPILPVESVDQLDDGRQALRMPLCAQSLAALVRRSGALGPDDVVVLGYALALALAAAHGAGILHGGVSPDNVLFGESGEPVLADFGVPVREAFPRDPLHNIEFVSPETLRSGEVDEGTDLYGLGAVLHFALSGNSPHPGRLGEQPSDRVLRVLGSPVPAINRPGVPVELSTVIARLLAPDAANRPPDADWVADQLAAILPDEPSPTGTFDDFEPEDAGNAEDGPSGSQPAVRSARRSIVVVSALAGAAVLAALVVLLVPLGASDQLSSTPRLPPPPASASPAELAPPARVDLADPVDLGDQVVLTWTSDRTLDFAVVVAGEGEANHVLLAQRNHTMTVPVDPVRKYCFLVQASDSAEGSPVYESRPKAIRGAVCRQ